MRAIPLDRILLETDGRHATDRGRPAQRRGLSKVATGLGPTSGTDLVQITNILHANQTWFLNRSQGTSLTPIPASDSVNR